MYLAIINTLTNLVENVVVPPIEGDIWIPPEGCSTILTDTGGIGYSYIAEEFISPE